MVGDVMARMFDDERIRVPAGWPKEVHPPGVNGWVATAESYLLSCCPSQYHAYQVLRRCPVVLARLATESVTSQLVASRAVLTGLRVSLTGVDTSTADRATQALWHEEMRLRRVAKEVDLVHHALRARDSGRSFEA